MPPVLEPCGEQGVPAEPYELDRPDGDHSAVAFAIRRGLATEN